MNERIQLPLRPSSSSLASYVAALDLLAARLDTLGTRARWPARIPINAKASFDGDIVHTDQVRVDVGAGWWVEMGAGEAAAYVRRRKAYFLEEHARLLEGKPRAPELAPEDVDMAPVPTHLNVPEVRFDTLFANPLRVPSPAAEAGGSASAGSAPTQPAQTAVNITPATPATPSDKDATDKDADKDADMPAENGQGQITIPGLPKELQYLVDMLGELKGAPAPNGGNETINDEGLPIHEIRETPDGEIIGDAPAPAEGLEEFDERNDDYFSPEAEARRAALRRKLFHDDSDSDDEEGMDEGMDVDSPEAAAPVEAPVAPAPPRPVSTPEPTSLAPPEAQTPLTLSPPSANRSPSNPPKSILKVPTRKKSVTFDPSTRLPPDSPPCNSPIGGLRMGKLGFPVAETVSESGPKAVPILAPPTPGRKTGTATFGGFKRGFLTGPGSTPPAVPAPSSAVVEGPKIVEVDGDVEMDHPESQQQPQPPKKQSLFAARRATAAPSLPRLADAKPMAAMKTAIVETPPNAVHHAPESSLSDRIQTPVAPRFGANMPPAVGTNPVLVVDHDDDSSDYGDLGDFSDDEEDEYALDEALLQREVALEFHRRQGWARPVDEDEIDPEAEDQNENVLMGVPRVSTVSGEGQDLRIVNPTADDLSQFLRVGRADDGELVFERPDVHDVSDSEGEDEGAEERRERRARRQDVMARLLAGDYEDAPTVQPAQRAKEWEASLPPSVGADPSAPAPAAPAPAPRRIETGPVVERSGPTAPPAAPEPAAPEAPRKVSRFKAARQG